MSKRVWYILASTGASWSAAALRINAGIESGPVALNGFIPLSSLWTPFQLTSMLGILGNGLGPLSGRELVSSFVNTDTNWLLRMLALSTGAIILEEAILVL